MQVKRLTIPEVLLLQPRVFIDERGCFYESWNRERYHEAGIQDDFVQDNVSISKKGVLRGLHAQRAPHAQGKLVSVLQGRVYDVAVDARQGSATYGQWVGVELTRTNGFQLYVPPGFLHGFLALEDDTIFCYKCTADYTHGAEFSVAWNDPTLRIEWPLDASPCQSLKDSKAPLFEEVAKIHAMTA
jgi:dTDP-4-dehydrorhamnose 3,5-epimerase